MSKFKLTVAYTMRSSDINVVGGMLGFGWNEVCEYVQKCGIYGEDGSGQYIVSRGESFEHEQIDAIFDKIFADNPGVEEITIINE